MLMHTIDQSQALVSVCPGLHDKCLYNFVELMPVYIQIVSEERLIVVNNRQVGVNKCPRRISSGK